MCLNLDALKARTITLPNADQLDFGICFTQPFAVRFEIAVKRKQPKKLLHGTNDLKREEGKPYKVAIIACANKLLHWIYAILKTKTPFQENI